MSEVSLVFSFFLLLVLQRLPFPRDILSWGYALRKARLAMCRFVRSSLFLGPEVCPHPLVPRVQFLLAGMQRRCVRHTILPSFNQRRNQGSSSHSGGRKLIVSEKAGLAKCFFYSLFFRLKKKMRVSIVGASYPWNEKVEMQMRIRIKNHYLLPQTGHGERNSTSAETPARAGQSPRCLNSKRDRGTAQGRAPRQLQSPTGQVPRASVCGHAQPLRLERSHGHGSVKSKLSSAELHL